VKTVDIIEELRVYIARNHKTQSAAAEHWAVSRNFVSMVMLGKKQPTEAMIRDAGCKRITPPPPKHRYVKIKEKEHA
jgi:hypothetical protein